RARSVRRSSRIERTVPADAGYARMALQFVRRRASGRSLTPPRPDLAGADAGSHKRNGVRGAPAPGQGRGTGANVARDGGAGREDGRQTSHGAGTRGPALERSFDVGLAGFLRAPRPDGAGDANWDFSTCGIARRAPSASCNRGGIARQILPRTG